MRKSYKTFNVNITNDPALVYLLKYMADKMSGFADVSGKRYVCFVNRSTAIVGGLLDL